MTPLARRFIEGMGKPDPAVENAIHFQATFPQRFWNGVVRDTGAGWFHDRFVYLFGPGLERLKRCLDAWPFLVKPNHPDRIILGYNIHGAILVLENGNKAIPKVYVLEPYIVSYWTHPHLGIENLLGRWLPERQLPYFLDTGVYEQWRRITGKTLPEDTILAPKVPLNLGGPRTLDNFQVEDIFDYYESSAPIFADAVEKPPPPKPRKAAAKKKAPAKKAAAKKTPRGRKG